MPGAATFLQPVQDIRIGGRQSNAQYQYTLQAETTEELQKYGPLLLAELRQAPGFADVNTDQQNNGLQALLTYDRPTAARLGMTPQLIDNTLYHAFGQSEVVHHLYAAESVLRGDGSGSEILAVAGRIEEHLPDSQHGRRADSARMRRSSTRPPHRRCR